MERNSNNVRSGLKAVLFMMAMLFTGGNAMAGSVKWEDLNGNERSVLKAFQKEWESFPDKKQKALRRWASIPATERARIRERFGEWKQLSPPQQKKVARQLARFKAMPPAQKARIKSWHEWVKKLPEDERKKLKQKWPGMTEAERKAYMRDLQKKYGRS